MAESKGFKIDPVTGLVIGGVAFMLLGANKLFSWFDKSPEQKAKEAQQEKDAGKVAGNLWYLDTNFYKKPGAPKKYVAFKDKNYPNIAAENIYKSKGAFNDDESKMWGVIRSLGYQSQVPLIAGAFRTKYNKDLGQYLRSFLNNAEMAEVINYLEQLPKGF